MTQFVVQSKWEKAMTIMIELPAEVAYEIVARATREGQNPADYVQQLAVRDVAKDVVHRDKDRQQTPKERADAFVRWANAHSKLVPPLSQEAISRESFYAEDLDETV
jgi:hypothetical protein